MKDNLVVVDVETSGLDPKTFSIVSIGAVMIETGAEFYGECDIWPGAGISDGALKVNGFTYADITGGSKKSEADLVKIFLHWLPKNPIMIAHNASFDRDFMIEACNRAGVKSPFSFRTIDIHSIMFMHLLRTKKTVPFKLSLNACLKGLGLPPEPNPHNALTGAKCEADVFNKIYVSD